MKMLKQISACLLLVCMLLTSLPIVQAAETALTRGETAAILLVAADDYNPGVILSDILKGYPDGSLREDEIISRVQALVMLQRAFDGLPVPKGDNARSGYPASNFKDVPAWAKKELASVLASGIFAGTDPETFSPNESITDKQLDLFIRRTYALEGTNLKDDFYATINKTSLDNSQILPGNIGTGAFMDLSLSVSEDVANIIQELNATGGKTTGERKLVALYRNILNLEARNAEGIAPLQPYLDAIQNAQNLEELMVLHQKVYKELGANLLLAFGLTVDSKDSDSYILTFSGVSPRLGQRGYGANATPHQKKIYQTYLRTTFSLAGETKEAAAHDAEYIWNTDEKLAAASLSVQDSVDVDKIYNIYTMKSLQAMLPSVNLSALFATTGFKQRDRIMVSDPGKLAAFAEIFSTEKTPNSLNILKAYCKLGLLQSYAVTLNEDFQRAADTFNADYLGMSGTASLEENAAIVVQQLMSSYLGEAYVSRYFSAEAKADVEAMIADILSVYHDRIQNLNWMSDTTKKKAAHKLDTMKINVGYPNSWDDQWENVEVLSVQEGGSYFKNIVALSVASQKMLVELQKEGVSDESWVTLPYTVNAFYSPTDNSITFPAGILQKPFYEEGAAREKNLGGVGYLIAHEITHAFDNNGAKFDASGNAADWWTQQDYTAFRSLCDKVVALYDGREIAPGIACSGSLTLSENIADIGAVACITELVGRDANPDYRTLYTAMAEIWESSYSRETRQYLAQVDLHAPDKLRGSLTLQNFEPFYKTFGIQEGDGMWLAPEDRVTIW